MKMVMWILVVIAAVLLLPIPRGEQEGSYNFGSHLAYCRTRSVCVHEIGHALDQRAGFVSATDAFYKAVQMYLFVEMRKPMIEQLPANLMEFTFRYNGTAPRREIYAYLFQQADGDEQRVPESLRGFYDWQLARRFLSMLRDGQHIYVLNTFPRQVIP